MVKARLTIDLERSLLGARWLLVPMYLGLVIVLVALVVVFMISMVSEMTHLLATPPERLPEAGILMALTLIDLSLAANLVIIVILSGYENFVGSIDSAEDARPEWMGTIDFFGLKMKLISSVIAISAIALLHSYLKIGDSPIDPDLLSWQVIIQVTFVGSGVLMGLMELITSRTENHS